MRSIDNVWSNWFLFYWRFYTSFLARCLLFLFVDIFFYKEICLFKKKQIVLNLRVADIWIQRVWFDYFLYWYQLELSILLFIFDLARIE